MPRLYDRKTVFNISEEELDAIYEAQGKKCAICMQDFSLCMLRIDHDHTSGAIRGLLCNLCNLMLGHFEKHEGIFEHLLSYLRHAASTVWVLRASLRD